MDYESAVYYLYDQETDMIFHIIHEWNCNKGKENKLQYWELLNPKMIAKEWEYNYKTGAVHEKIINKIQNVCIDNYLKLYINTVLFGHTSLHPFDYLESYLPEDEEWDKDKVDEWLEDFEWFACDDNWNWKISDYAIDEMQRLLVNLIAEEDYTKKLFWIDQILNVVHQRSDLSSWFIDGGYHGLNIIFDQIGLPA